MFIEFYIDLVVLYRISYIELVEDLTKRETSSNHMNIFSKLIQYIFPSSTIYIYICMYIMYIIYIIYIHIHIYKIILIITLFLKRQTFAIDTC